MVSSSKIRQSEANAKSRVMHTINVLVLLLQSNLQSALWSSLRTMFRPAFYLVATTFSVEPCHGGAIRLQQLTTFLTLITI